MQHNQFDHSPPQTTLTQHKWMDTRKVGRDDDEIRRNRLTVEAERKRKRKKDKPFAHGTGGVVAVENTEISELAQPVVLEAVVYESSDDRSFDGKLISPAEKRMRNARKVDDVTDGDPPLKTPTKLEKRKSNSKNPHSVMNRDLRNHIEAQNKIIAELRRKLQIIRDVSSDAKFMDTRQILQDNLQNTIDTQINILDGSEKDEVLASATKSNSKNIINLHFN